MIIWIASYPRSGNTFVRIILNYYFNIKTYSIYNDIYDIAYDDKLSDLVGHIKLPEDFDIDEARKSDEIYFIKTHELPPNENDKAIYIIRDGRESTQSFSKYRQQYFRENKNISSIIYGDDNTVFWGKHVSKWNPINRNNTLLIRFEILIKNPEEYIVPISEFIGMDIKETEIPSFEELKKINPKFFRSGKTNSWERELSEEEQISFWLKNYNQMIEYGYKDNIPKVFENDEYTKIFRSLSNENSYVLDVLHDQNKQLINIQHQRNELLAQLRKIQGKQNKNTNELKLELNDFRQELDIHKRMIYEIRRVLKCTFAWYIEKLYSRFQKYFR